MSSSIVSEPGSSTRLTFPLRPELRALLGALIMSLMLVASSFAAAAPNTQTSSSSLEGLSAKTATVAFEPIKTTTASYSVLVTAGRRARPRIAGSAHVVGKEELERYEADDIHRVLAPVPGVYVREEDGYGLRPNIGLRGASSDRSSKVTLLEDGILFGPAPYSAPAAYYFPITTRMIGVEVFKGPASVRHGPNTIGGAVNLLSRPIPKGEGALDLGLGNNRFGKLHVFAGKEWGRFGVLFEAVHLETTGFKTLDFIGGDTGFAKNEGTAKFRWESEPGGDIYQRLELKVGYADERSNETYLGITRADFAQSPYRRYVASALDRMDWMRTSAELNWFTTFSGAELRITAYRHDLDRTWRRLDSFRGARLDAVLERPDAPLNQLYYRILTGAIDAEDDPNQALLVTSNERRMAAQGVQILGRKRFSTGPLGHALEVGARLHFDAITRNHVEDAYRMRSRTLVPEGSASRPTLQNRDEALAWAFHALDEVKVGPLLFTPGVRLELIETLRSNRNESPLSPARVEGGSAVLIPGVGAHYAVGEALGLFAGVHRGFSPVSPGQRAEVQPELSTNYEAGARLDLQATRAELIGFFNDYENLTGECTFSTGCPDERLAAQFNGGRVSVYGLEAALGHAFTLGPRTRLRADLSYTLTQSRFRSAFVSELPLFGRVEANDSLPLVPEHQGALLAQLDVGPFSLNAKLGYVGAQRNRPGQGAISAEEAIPARAVLDAVMSWRFPLGTLYLRGDNLTNSDYLVAARPFGVRPGLPLMVLLGYKQTFGL